MKRGWIVIATLCALALLGVDAPSPEPTAQEIYVRSLRAMNELKEPAFVSYRLESKSEGLKGDTTAKCIVQNAHRN